MDYLDRIRQAVDQEISIVSGVVVITRHSDMVTVEIDPGAIISWEFSGFDGKGRGTGSVHQVFPDGGIIRFADRYCELDSSGPVEPICELVMYNVTYL